MACDREDNSGTSFRIVNLLIVFLAGCLLGAGALYFKNVKEMRNLAQQKLITEWQVQPVAIPVPATPVTETPVPETPAPAEKTAPAASAVKPVAEEIPEKTVKPLAETIPEKTVKSLEEEISEKAVKPPAKNPAKSSTAKSAGLDRKMYDLFVFQPLLNELLKNGNEFFLHVGKGMRHAEFARECNRFIGSMRKLEQLVVRGEIRDPEFKRICARLSEVEAALTLAWENRDFLDSKGKAMDPYLSNNYILIQLGESGLHNSAVTQGMITANTDPDVVKEIAGEARAHRIASQILHFFLYGPGRKHCRVETFRKKGRDYQVWHFRQNLIVIQNRANRAKNLYMVRYDSVADLLAVGEKEFAQVRNTLKRYVK